MVLRRDGDGQAAGADDGFVSGRFENAARRIDARVDSGDMPGRRNVDHGAGNRVLGLNPRIIDRAVAVLRFTRPERGIRIRAGIARCRLRRARFCRRRRSRGLRQFCNVGNVSRRIENRDAILHRFAMRQKRIVGTGVGQSRRGDDRDVVDRFQQIEPGASPRSAGKRVLFIQRNDVAARAAVGEESEHGLKQRRRIGGRAAAVERRFIRTLLDDLRAKLREIIYAYGFGRRRIAADESEKRRRAGSDRFDRTRAGSDLLDVDSGNRIACRHGFAPLACCGVKNVSRQVCLMTGNGWTGNG